MKPQQPESSAERFARSLAGNVRIVVTGLLVWELGAADAYGLPSEIAAVERTVDAHGWRQYHLFGFSAGATVALAVARAHPEAVRTLALFEPATVGDDTWSPVEVGWRRDLHQVRQLPVGERPPAFRRLLMAPGHNVPTELPAPQAWDERTDKLEDMLDAVGFASTDLGELTQPTLIMSGGRSALRFASLGERLAEVMPRARHVIFPNCHHLAPPHRVAQQALADELTALWSQSD